jgi:hypothetical protein
MHIVPNNGRFVNMGRFNSCTMLVRVEMFTQNGTKSEIGIFVMYQYRTNRMLRFEILRDDYRAALCFIKGLLIFGV